VVKKKAQARNKKIHATAYIAEATKANGVLSLAEQVLLELLKNDTSRVKGDFQARFCERLAGANPACLLDR